MMKKILWHAVSRGALIRSKPAESAPVLRSITNGTWLGVIKEFGEWIYVIGKECTGWVSKKELGSLETKLLHIKKNDDDLLRIGYSI
ncbi:MAG: SH3 domain-containing protein [Saprospiraceae bacterium]